MSSEPRRPPTVSVVVPTRDRPAEIARAVSVALSQSNVDLELIIVDDGSVVPVDPGPDPRIRLLRRPTSGGVATARNEGIAAATGTWIAFLDDDDLWAPDRLHKLVRAAEHEGADAVTGLTLAIDGRGRPLQLDGAPDVQHLRTELRSTNVLGGPSAVMVRRSLIEKAGVFDPTYAVLADWEFYLRLADHGRFTVYPEVLNGYVIHRGGMHVTQTAQALAEFERLVGRYGRADAPGGESMYDEYFLRWAAGAHRRAGRRVSASRLYLRNFARHRKSTDLARAGLTIVSERAMRYLGRGLRPPAPEAPQWMRPYVGPDGLRPGRGPV